MTSANAAPSALAPDSPAALQARLRDASVNDVLLGMFTEMLLERAGRLLGGDVADAARIRFLGGRRLARLFRYPVADALRILDHCASRAPDYGAWIRDCGGEAVRVFFDSPVGRAMAVLGAPEPHRLIASTPAGYRVCVSWGERRYRRISANEAVVEFRLDLLGPSWHLGAFDEGLRGACRVQPDLGVLTRDEAGMNFDLRARW